MRYIFCLLLLWLPAALPAQQQHWHTFTTELDSLARADGVVGWSAVLVQDGRITARDDQGMADRERRQPVTAATVFHYGSITKTLTAIGIMQLAEHKLISLDDPVVKYVPELRQVHDPFGSMDSITIRMLLSHSSGFQNPTFPWRQYQDWEPFEPTEWSQLAGMMPYMSLRFRPGSRYGYSNPGYVFLAKVIERVTGDPWEGYVHKNIFQPLGLAESSFRHSPWYLADRRSGNYTVVRDSASGRDSAVANAREFDPGITVPNSGWNAPLSDLAVYAGVMSAIARGDAAWARRLLPGPALRAMWEPKYRISGEEYNAGADNWMGMGFFIYHRGGSTMVGHTGYQAGFRSLLFMNPATGRAVIAVLNTDNSADGAASGERLHRIEEAALRMVM
jgi:CubicO group peptidase (beta-lactamase class C family)